MRALICGISGQGGAHLTRLLLDKGNEGVGASRDAQIGSFENPVRVGADTCARLESMAANHFRSVLNELRKIDILEIFDPAGPSTVGLSFEQLKGTSENIADLYASTGYCSIMNPSRALCVSLTKKTVATAVRVAMGERSRLQRPARTS
ncbi:GDP-mannose 4,6-dehydratase [Mycobacterium seoulense]|uniref:GDP-mannose 4,6-dehydratase n=1 Tax=Mycobacterium seoulense TaxID=386911 RepID=UPI003CF3A66E